MELFKPSVQSVRLLQRIAASAGLFAFVICLLVLVNYYQLRRSDPLNTPAMKVLIERMNQNPGDEQVKQEIRELDLLARKAFFTNRWQIKTGGYLLVFNLLIVIICLKTIELYQQKIPNLPESKEEHFWDDRLLNRRWLAYSGLLLVVISLFFAYLTHQKLGTQLSRASSAAMLQQKELSSPIEQSPLLDSGFVRQEDSAELKSLASAYPDQEEINRNFPGFRGPGGNGISFHKKIPASWDGRSGKNIRWKTPIPLPGYNSPVIWNDKVFLTGASDSKREVYCFDLADGKMLWKYSVGKLPGSPAVSPKVNGETGFAAPTVVTDGRRVYAIFANGDLVAIQMDGKQAWMKNLGSPKNHYGHSSSLLVYNDLLIIQYDQSGNASVIALKAETGSQAWKTSREVKVSWSSPILVNTGKRMELILVAEPYMVAYNPSNGKELWKIDCISGEVGPSAAYADGIAYSVNDYSKLAAVKTGAEPVILWENDEYLSDIPSPLATGKYLFLPTSYGTMVCYDSKDGTKYWEKDFGTPTYASPILADGKIYQMDKKGIMHIFKPDNAFNPVSEPQLGEGSVCTPAFADGLIVVRGDKNLYCIGK